MSTPPEPTDQDLYLAHLNCSDVDTEALLAGGVDIDDLITSGALPTDTEGWGWQVDNSNVGTEELKTYTEEEALALIRARQEWRVANGFA